MEKVAKGSDTKRVTQRIRKRRTAFGMRVLERVIRRNLRESGKEKVRRSRKKDCSRPSMKFLNSARMSDVKKL